MMKNPILFLISILFLTGCLGDQNGCVNTPLITLIKLHSAESNRDYDKAIELIDVEAVYGSDESGKTAEEAWRDFVDFNHNLGQDKRFLNQFNYHRYEITQDIEGNKASVRFTPKESSSDRSIVYSLIIDTDGKWIVNGIEREK